MTARALTWFEDDDPRDLVRWSVAAAVVVLIHAALVAGYLLWQQQSDEEPGDESSAIAIELVVPEIEMQEQARVDAPPPPQETIPTHSAMPKQRRSAIRK